MPRNVTVTFADGSTHVYQNAPDDVTPEQITQRAQQEFGKDITALDGGRQAASKPLSVDITDTGEGPYDPKAMSVDQLAELERGGFALNQNTGMYERAPTPAPTPAVPEGTPDDSILGRLKSFGLGVAKPLDNIAHAISQTTGIGAESDQQYYDQQQGRRAADPNKGYQLGGNIVGTIPTLALPGGGFVQGAAAGALLSDAESAGGVIQDAAVGGTLGKAGDVAAGLIAPKVSPYLQTLRDAGVRVTTGDIAGQGGLFGRGLKNVEDVLARTPVVGGTARGAQDLAVLDLNRAAINRSLKPIGESLPKANGAGHEAIAFAADKLKAAYGDVLPRLRGTLDRTFQRRIDTIDARVQVPDEYLGKLDAVKTDLKNAFQRAGPDGAYSGRTLRDASERLEDVASAWRKSDDPYERRIGDVAEQYRQQLHALARRQNPAQAARLRNVDKGYASLVRVEKAALSSADGVFTPAQYRAATRATDRSARRSASARGRALDQDLATAADIVMTNRAAVGGSKDVNSLIALGAGATAAATGNPLAIAGAGALGAGAAAYTRPVQAAGRWALTHSSGPVADNLSEIVRYGSRALAGTVPPSIHAISE